MALTALGGLGTGLVTTLFSFAGLVAGAIVGASLAPQFLSDGVESQYTGLVGIGGALLGAVLLCALARFVGSFVRGGLHLLPPLRMLDSLGGAVLGAVFGFTLVWVGGAVAMQLADRPEVRKEVRHSEVIRRLNQIVSPDDLLNIDERLNRAVRPARPLVQQVEHGRGAPVRGDDVHAVAAAARARRSTRAHAPSRSRPRPARRARSAPAAPAGRRSPAPRCGAAARAGSSRAARRRRAPGSASSRRAARGTRSR